MSSETCLSQAGFMPGGVRDGIRGFFNQSGVGIGVSGDQYWVLMRHDTIGLDDWKRSSNSFDDLESVIKHALTLSGPRHPNLKMRWRTPSQKVSLVSEVHISFCTVNKCVTHKVDPIEPKGNVFCKATAIFSNPKAPVFNETIGVVFQDSNRYLISRHNMIIGDDVVYKALDVTSRLVPIDLGLDVSDIDKFGLMAYDLIK